MLLENLPEKIAIPGRSFISNTVSPVQQSW